MTTVTTIRDKYNQSNTLLNFILIGYDKVHLHLTTHFFFLFYIVIEKILELNPRDTLSVLLHNETNTHAH